MNRTRKLALAIASPPSVGAVGYLLAVQQYALLPVGLLAGLTLYCLLVEVQIWVKA